MRIPFLDVGAGYAELRGELDAAVARVLASGWYVLGPEVEAFEADWAGYCGTRHCVGVASGLDALTLILRGYGIGPGDEVVVPANTYIATWLAVSAVGATPVPVEPDPVTATITAETVEPALGRRTRAVIAVHLHGRLAETRPLLALCRSHGVRLVEDAAQAHGAQRDGRRAGALGDAAGFSFYPGKNLGAFGDGGAVTTDDAELADAVRVLRNYGSRVKYRNEVIGVNSRLDPLQAALLRVKLAHLDRWNLRRTALAARYAELLGDAEVELPAPAGPEHAWHLFVVRSARRDALRHHLAAAGIETVVHYPIPPHRSEAYAGAGWAPGDFPVTEALAASALSLPLGPHLAPAALEAVAEAVRMPAALPTRAATLSGQEPT